jgi:dimethylhistidine N-methyltransferase
MPNTASNHYGSFAADVIAGLSATPKYLSSKYFYDDAGSRLFQAIMNLPEYYLTRAEQEIFEMQAAAICDAFSQPSPEFELVELGAGDGVKTAILIEQCLRQRAQVTYTPIDISSAALDGLTAHFAARFAALPLRPLCGDYFEMLEQLKTVARRKVILFLGSNIGNFSQAEAVAFFSRLRAVMSDEDRLFIGFDLQKDPRVILRAYDDEQGITAQFNLNLLARINRTFNGDFSLDDFAHYAAYHPVECAARSFLMSRKAQTVTLAALQRSFTFQPWEPIFTEISQKYSAAMIAALAQASGFEVAQTFYDLRRYFADVIWRR